MKSCIFCVQKHLGTADGYLQEYRAGYRGRLVKCLGQLGLAEEEAFEKYPDLSAKIRKFRKDLEAVPASYGSLPEDLLAEVEDLASRSNPSQRKNCPEDGESEDMDRIREKDKDCPDCVKKRNPPHFIPVPKPAVGPKDPEGGFPRKLILLTALSDFKASYSLVTVILDQAKAAAAMGMDVVLVGMENMTTVLPEIPGVRFAPGVPMVRWQQDLYDQKMVDILKGWLQGYLAKEAPAIVLSHDFLFQAWYLNMAAAIHQMDPIQNIHWYHQMHSGVGRRPEPEIAKYRAAVPEGHYLVNINHADIHHVARYYDTTEDRIKVLPNIREPVRFLGLSERVQMVADAAGLMERDIVQIYPLSTPRSASKGVDKVLRVFALLTHYYGKDTALVLANAHANGKDGREILQVLKGYASALNLSDRVFFTSDLVPESVGEGLHQDEVRQLLDLSNVFCFPSESEACGLVMLEAALTHNLLVLNEDLPTLKDFIHPDQAIWVPWGSLRKPRGGEDLERITAFAAREIMQSLAADRIGSARRQALRSCGLKHLQAAMAAIWP